jgi:hypothetical protein
MSSNQLFHSLVDAYRVWFSCFEQQQSTKVKLLPIAKNSKLKEDITSLGSDDSGICGSDSSAETRPKGSEETIATEEVKVRSRNCCWCLIIWKLMHLV